jgi:hypothetical protein
MVSQCAALVLQNLSVDINIPIASSPDLVRRCQPSHGTLGKGGKNGSIQEHL